MVTKLDGTAKGGVLAAIAQERPIPCISSAWARSWKTWKPSTRASSRRPCCPDLLSSYRGARLAPRVRAAQRYGAHTNSVYKMWLPRMMGLYPTQPEAHVP